MCQKEYAFRFKNKLMCNILFISQFGTGPAPPEMAKHYRKTYTPFLYVFQTKLMLLSVNIYIAHIICAFYRGFVHCTHALVDVPSILQIAKSENKHKNNTERLTNRCKQTQKQTNISMITIRDFRRHHINNHSLPLHKSPLWTCSTQDGQKYKHEVRMNQRGNETSRDQARK